MNMPDHRWAFSTPLSVENRERDAARMFLSQLSAEKRIVLLWMAEERGCSEEALVSHVWGDAIERWMQGEE